MAAQQAPRRGFGRNIAADENAHRPAAPRYPASVTNDAAAVGPPPSDLDFERQKAFQDKLNRVLTNRATFLRSSEASFTQFDKDQNGWLDFSEVKQLLHKLISNLQLPPLEDRALLKIFKRYDKKYEGYLCLPEFQRLYWELLHTIRDKFYPTKVVKVRRSSFVGQTDLARGNRSIGSLFSFEKRLGAGSFGEVFLVKEKTSGFVRVCKVINKDLSKIPMEQIDAEIEVLKKLDHPNIIKVFEVYSDANSIYIIMETCDGGELADRISETFDKGYILTEEYVASLMKQLLHAVNYFHQAKVAHKDLKPQNILYQSTAPDSPIKVIDFGLAEIFEREEVSKNAAGTYLYMAPEVLDFVVTLKCDVWSCGCIMFQLLTGVVPFPGTTLEEVEYALRYSEADYDKLQGLPISEDAVDLLKHMLQKELSERYTAQQCLDHPWLRSGKHSTASLPAEICANLKKFRKQSNLKNILTNMLAHQLNVAGTQVSRINEIFKSLDADGNGLLSKRELADGLSRAGFRHYEITQIANALDVDGSDTVGYTEFLAACYTWRASELNVVWSAFNKLDADGDGKITVDEFVQCLRGASNPGKSRLVQNDNELAKLIREIDRNGDGTVDWNEFVAYMKS